MPKGNEKQRESARGRERIEIPRGWGLNLISSFFIFCSDFFCYIFPPLPHQALSNAVLFRIPLPQVVELGPAHASRALGVAACSRPLPRRRRRSRRRRLDNPNFPQQRRVQRQQPLDASSSGDVVEQRDRRPPPAPAQGDADAADGGDAAPVLGHGELGLDDVAGPDLREDVRGGGRGGRGRGGSRRRR